jgi:Protein of unknown function (DUF3306)
MNDRETFLARWSRRKQAAAAETSDAEFSAVPALGASKAPVDGREPPAETTGADGSHGGDVETAAGGKDAVPAFDLASLPPIESIVADTDIRAFLAPGVPPELARAALRRAWAADPQIRDFVGLADYDWDFNAPGSMAGFGPLEMTEELRQVAARIIGQSPLAKPDAGPGSDGSGQMDSGGESPEFVGDMTEREAVAADPPSERDPRIAAVQSRSDATEKSQLVMGPRHGGALPK